MTLCHTIIAILHLQLLSGALIGESRGNHLWPDAMLRDYPIWQQNLSPT